MSAPAPRGACPSLKAPMASGDGLIVRLVLPELAAAGLAALAAAATRFGNGHVEVTRRGSLQVRGLSAASVPGFAAALAAAGIAVPAGPPVLESPLAGRDPGARADPRPLAAALRAYARPLAAKIGVIVDGGGALPLGGIAADLRLTAVAGGWHLAAGGTAAHAVPLGTFPASEALPAATSLLDRLAASGGRARDLALVPAGEPLAPGAPAEAVARFALRDGIGRGIALPFGASTGAVLGALAAAVPGAAFRPAPDGVLIAVGLSAAAEAALLAAAAAHGLVTDAADPRRLIAACAGAPACASARLATRPLAAAIAAAAPELPAGARLHVSGCGKRCAQPEGPAVSLVGTLDGPVVTGEGIPVPEALGRRLRRLAEARPR